MIYYLLFSMLNSNKTLNFDSKVIFKYKFIKMYIVF